MIPLGLLMGRLASFVILRIEKQRREVVMSGSVGLTIKVDKLCVAHPTNGRPCVGWKTAKRFPPFGIEVAGVVMGIAALHPSYESAALLLPFALSYTTRPNNAVPESRQEAEWRCCGEGRLAWRPNEERWARDGPS